MFKKIVSNLSFGPALVGQLNFYAKRLRKEEATRRMGLIFVALALVVQSLVVFQPPESANASHPSDFVPGGLGLGSNRSLNNFIRPYDANSKYLKDIMNRFGITRNEITSTQFGSWLATNKKISWGHTARPNSSPVRVNNSAGTQVATVYGRTQTDYFAQHSCVRLGGLLSTNGMVRDYAIMRQLGDRKITASPANTTKTNAFIVTGKQIGRAHV